MNNDWRTARSERRTVAKIGKINVICESKQVCLDKVTNKFTLKAKALKRKNFRKLF